MTGRTSKSTRNILKHLFISLAILLLVAACGNRNYYSENSVIPAEGWSRYNKPLFKVEINDTTGAYDIILSLRTAHNYPFRNIFMFITTSSPGGYSIKDTLEYQLANEKGEWYGTGLGDMKSITLPYRTNIIFPEAGTYAFTIEQGMRREYLEGVTDIGLIIKERAK